jgi:rhodanese-related sulfurtransferase/DNA-binding transcriptional ArsR family regulator
MSSHNPKQIIYSHIAALTRALAHEHRLELLEHLGQGEWPVETLAEKSGLTFANASQHLHLMRRNGLVVSRRSGKNVFYRLADGPVLAALAAIRALAENNVAEVQATVESYFSGIDSLEPATFEELKARLDDTNLLMLDVRDEEEYRQGHLPSAVHIPMRELESRLAQLPPGREIIAYCRGPYCILSFKAVQLLRSHGFSSRRMQDGFPEWAASGGGVEAAAA